MTITTLLSQVLSAKAGAGGAGSVIRVERERLNMANVKREREGEREPRGIQRQDNTAYKKLKMICDYVRQSIHVSTLKKNIIHLSATLSG